MLKRNAALFDLGRQLGLKGGFHRLSSCTDVRLPNTEVFSTATAVEMVAGDHCEDYILTKVISPRWSAGFNPSSGFLYLREAATGECCCFICPLRVDIHAFTAWMLKEVVDVVLAQEPEPAKQKLLPPELRARPSQPMRWNL